MVWVMRWAAKPATTAEIRAAGRIALNSMECIFFGGAADVKYSVEYYCRMERPETQGRALRELAIVHQLSATRLNRALRPLGVTLTHTAVLSHLARAPQGRSAGDIAAATEVNQP